MKYIYVLLFCLTQLKICNSANILGIAPYNGKSHFTMFEALFKGLAQRGHNVDVVGHFPLKEKLQGYNDIRIIGNFPQVVNNITVDAFINKDSFTSAKIIMDIAGPTLCKNVLETDTMKSLKDTTKKYDILITEYFAMDCMLGFAHLFKIPAIAVTTSVTLPWYTSYIGLPDNPAYIPNYFMPFTPTMTLTERVMNSVVYIISKVVYDVYSVVESNTLAKNFFGPDLPDLRVLAANVSMVLVNSHFSFNMARPTVPNFLEVGGLHINENFVLPKYFNDSLKTDLKGIIYLNFGSLLLTESLPEDKLRSFFEVFRNIPYKVMWKATREKFSKNLDIPSNIQFEPWMPQMAILCHPNVKLFVSHGGLMGTMEALHCAVPILGIPLFSDQALNIQASVANGIAVHVDYNNITEKSISEAISLLLDDSSYSENVKRASTLFKDRPMSAMDTANYWIEYVIRHKGARHLRTVGADLPWYQYCLVDVGLILFAIISVLLVTVYYIISNVYRLVFRKERRKIKQN